MAAKKWNTEQHYESAMVGYIPLPARFEALRALTESQYYGRGIDHLVSEPPLEKDTETERVKVLRVDYELRAGAAAPNSVEVWAVYTIETKTARS